MTEVEEYFRSESRVHICLLEGNTELRWNIGRRIQQESSPHTQIRKAALQPHSYCSVPFRNTDKYRR